MDSIQTKHATYIIFTEIETDYRIQLKVELRPIRMILVIKFPKFKKIITQ